MLSPGHWICAISTPRENADISALRYWELIVHIAESVLPSLHLSQVKYARVRNDWPERINQ